jgi:hypothetical protein
MMKKERSTKKHTPEGTEIKTEERRERRRTEKSVSFLLTLEGVARG